MRAVFASRSSRVTALAAIGMAWSLTLYADELSSPTLQELSATRERPLFSPDRRKEEQQPRASVDPTPSPPAAQQIAQPPQLTLVGTIISSDGTLIFLRDGGSSNLVTLRSGETFGRWQVSALSDSSVQLRDGEQQFKLEMFSEP